MFSHLTLVRVMKSMLSALAVSVYCHTGDAEAAIRRAFRLARQSAPCVSN